MGIWRRRTGGASSERSERYDAPSKDHVHRSTEEQIIDRLRRMQLPEPPPGAKERGLERYREWLRDQGRQPWQ